MRKPDNAPRKNLIYIQYLRGIAALLVVFHHLFHERVGMYSPLGGSDFGRPGVLIFFVISGFIMLHAARGESVRVFALRRVIRVAPLYWLMTLVFFVLILRGDIARGVPLDHFGELAASLLFVPHFHQGVPTEIWPILVPGWTLNYEMFFFVLFAIGLATGHVRRVTIALLLGLAALGAVLNPVDARMITYTSPFLLLFAVGMGLAWLRERELDFGPAISLLPMGLALVLVSGLQVLPQGLTTPAYFLAAVMTVVGTIAAEDRLKGREWRLLGWIGDASYSLYLSHTILMVFLFKGLLKLPLTGPLQFVVIAVVVLITCVGAALIIYRYIEAPMSRGLRRRFAPSARAPSAPIPGSVRP